MIVIGKFACLFCLAHCVLFVQGVPNPSENDSFDNLFNLTKFQDGMDFSKQFDVLRDEINDLPTIDQKTVDAINEETEKRRIHKFFYEYFMGFVGLFIGVILVLTFYYKCCKKRTIGIVHRESILVIVAARHEEGQQPTPKPDTATPPPSYEEAVVIPPLPTAEELMAKKQNNQIPA